jgi:hypothetical protein
VPLEAANVLCCQLSIVDNQSLHPPTHGPTARVIAKTWLVPNADQYITNVLCNYKVVGSLSIAYQMFFMDGSGNDSKEPTSDPKVDGRQMFSMPYLLLELD